MSSRHLFYQLALFPVSLSAQSAPSGLLVHWAGEGEKLKARSLVDDVRAGEQGADGETILHFLP